MDRLVQRNVLAMSGRAVEAAGDVNTLLLDKTGTITLGNRQAAEFLAVDGVDTRAVADAVQLSSLADAGKGVVELIGTDVAAFCDDLVKDSRTYADVYQESVSAKPGTDEK